MTFCPKLHTDMCSFLLFFFPFFSGVAGFVTLGKSDWLMLSCTSLSGTHFACFLGSEYHLHIMLESCLRRSLLDGCIMCGCHCDQFMGDSLHEILKLRPVTLCFYSIMVFGNHTCIVHTHQQLVNENSPSSVP